MTPSYERLAEQTQRLLVGLTVKGFGIDLIEVSRIEMALKRHPERFAHRILTPSEWNRFAHSAEPHRYLAKQFAAKEAIAKALGTGIAQGISFHQLQVLRDALGAPYVELSGAAAQRCHFLGGHCVRVAITDEVHWAMAAAVVVASAPSGLG